MDIELNRLFAQDGIHNFVFIGEAGCGKSEIAINLAVKLAQDNRKPVHFFDLDMTKPLFRSRDQASCLEDQGVIVHYEEQFYDAPTVAGGTLRLLRDDTVYTVLDVGGDYIGARAIGGYAHSLNAPGTAVFYVINPYRPWSADIEHIDRVLGETLGVSHIRLDRLTLLGNPNLGPETLTEDVIRGARQLQKNVGPYKPVAFYTVWRPLYEEVCSQVDAPVYPIDLYLTYEWNQE